MRLSVLSPLSLDSGSDHGDSAFISNSFHFGNLIALSAMRETVLARFSLLPSGRRYPPRWQGGAVLHRNVLGITSENPMKVRGTAGCDVLLVTSHRTTSEQVGTAACRR